MPAPYSLTFEPVHHTGPADLVRGDGALLRVRGRDLYAVSVERREGGLTLSEELISQLPADLTDIGFMHCCGRVLNVLGRDTDGGRLLFAFNVGMRAWRDVSDAHLPKSGSRKYIGTDGAWKLLATMPCVADCDKMYCTDSVCSGRHTISHVHARLPQMTGIQTRDAPACGVDIPADQTSCDMVFVENPPRLHIIRTNAFWSVSDHQSAARPCDMPAKQRTYDGRAILTERWTRHDPLPSEAYNPAVLSRDHYLIVIGGRFHEDHVHAYNTNTYSWEDWGTVPVSLDRGVVNMIDTNTAIITGVSKSTTGVVTAGEHVTYRLTFETPEEAERRRGRGRERGRRRAVKQEPVNLLLQPPIKREARQE
ncbi:hypothetical protein KIPB_006205 [Kipferlia bialata]|uniref:Kelch-type beta propeller n=1 Tax=Kipferlia bialata TaxID=797122 RepID=A0A391NWI3_9EUKA|nr:hypothetical protein KIPB_006205 [Kipferlia bialata]|eukprot:g6205.t1